MAANSFGDYFTITTFGESHGVALGVVVDGCPANINWDPEVIEQKLALRKPGQSDIVSSRNETEEFEVLSGIFEGKTLGTPICIIVKNKDQRSSDYDDIKKSPRLGHADDTWVAKFGHTDHRGGGRSSGRETLCRVLGAAVAEMVLKQLCPEVQVMGYTKSIGNIMYEGEISPEEHAQSRHLKTRFPCNIKDQQAVDLLLQAKELGNSYGGQVGLKIVGVPSGVGEPVFHKLKSQLASAMMSIGATCGLEFGDGFSSTTQEGSVFHQQERQEKYGGIRGGISTGEPIQLNVAFKPTSSVLDVAKQGRHDPCIVPRAVVVVESMAILVILNMIMAQSSRNI